MKIGLFFGSFNPIHIGHVAIAKYILKSVKLDQVWMVVSPHNPLKDKSTLADAKKRLAQVKKAVARSPKIKVSSVELSLPKPSYTIYTLNFLKKKYPRNTFSLIIGSDNLKLFHKWKDYKKILAGYQIYVYPRNFRLKGGKRGLLVHRNVKMLNAPRIDISSTFIREQINKGKNVKHYLP